MRTRSGTLLSLSLAVALSAALALPPGSALGSASPVATGAGARATVKQARTGPAKATTSALRPKAVVPVVRSTPPRSVVDARVTHAVSEAPRFIDPLAPAVLGELVVVLDSSIVAPAAERSLESRGAKVEQVKGDAATLLVTAPGGLNDPVFTEVAKDAPGVAWVQPNYLYRAASLDPLFDQQWGLTQIGVPSAWIVTRGAASVVVAVRQAA